MSEIDAKKQVLFAKWAESELSPQEQQQFEVWCQEDTSFADRVALHGKMEFMAENYQQQDVPGWDPGGLFDAPEKSPWWQWRGLPVMSFAMSIFAVLLVTFKFEVTVNDGSMVISFAGSDKQKVEQLVNEKLLEYAQLQEAKFTEKSDFLQQQQLQMNTQLASYLLESSRSERREDFAELIKHVNEQRADDQSFYARQFNRIKNDLELSDASPEWLPANFEQPNSDN